MLGENLALLGNKRVIGYVLVIGLVCVAGLLSERGKTGDSSEAGIGVSQDVRVTAVSGERSADTLHRPARVIRQQKGSF